MHVVHHQQQLAIPQADHIQQGRDVGVADAPRPALNEVWKTVFGDHRPARSAVEVAAFGRPEENPRFMIEVTARIGG